MYPLKFKPIVKKLLWGTEQWLVSGMAGNESVVSNGILRNNTLSELLEVYMSDLVGEETFEQRSDEFPVLVKLIDAREQLSVQVHPDDRLARERHGASGKSEMWYVVSAGPEAVIYAGFNHPVTEAEYLKSVTKGTLTELLMRFEVRTGDAFFIPAGTVHAIGAGVRIVEIQQPSDITYRIFDWNRIDNSGNLRRLHTCEATDAIDFESRKSPLITRHQAPNSVAELVATPYFTVNQVVLSGHLERDYEPLDSFVVLFCTAGNCTIVYSEGVQPLASGEAILVPAMISDITLVGSATLLELYL